MKNKLILNINVSRKVVAHGSNYYFCLKERI